jgi:hypothetical protein
MKSQYKYILWIGALLACGPTTVFAGAWTLPAGELWTKVTYFHQTADEWYLASPEFGNGQIQEVGERRPYRFNGQYKSKALFAEAFYGLTDRLDIGLQVPYFAQEYADDTRLDTPSDSGIGDVRLSAKWRVISQPALFTLKVGAKMPTGDFRNEDGIVPVGEGQWDFDFVGQVGRSFWPLPLYANLGVGYRVRMKNKEVDRDPGDEWFYNAEVGVHLGSRLLLMAKIEGLRSDPSVDFGSIKNRSQIKRVTYFNPALSVGLGGGTALELGLRSTLNGRNFAAGHQLTAGLSAGFGK